jgi:hypothetical protein
VSGKPVGQALDAAGGVEEGEVTRWFSSLLNEAGLVGIEDDSDAEGFKNE